MKNVRVMYLKDNNNHLVGCLAINSNFGKKSAQYQVTSQNSQDSFDKSLGRQLAIGRLVEVPIVVDLQSNSSIHDVSRAVMTDLLSRNVSSRVKRAARRWLASAPSVKPSETA